MGDKTYIIKKKSGKEYKVTVKDGKRVKIHAAGSKVVAVRSSTGKIATRQEATVDEVQKEQVVRQEVDLKSRRAATEATASAQAPQEKEYKGAYYLDEQGRRIGIDTNIQPSRQDKLDKRISESITQQRRATRKIKSGGLRGVFSKNYWSGIGELALGRASEAGLRAAGSSVYTGKGIYYGTKAFLSDKTPTRDKQTKESFKRSVSLLTPSKERVKDNPLNVLPAGATAAYQTGTIGVMSQQLEAARLQTTTTKTSGAITTKARGKQINFWTAEKGTGRVTLEQSKIGIRTPKSLGGLGMDPIKQKTFTYELSGRGSAIATSKKFAGSKVAKTTSEQFLTVKSGGKTIFKNELVSQSRGVSTGKYFVQHIKGYDPFTGKTIKTTKEVGIKDYISLNERYSVQQAGVSKSSLSYSKFQEQLVYRSGGYRGSVGDTKSKTLQLGRPKYVNTLGSKKGSLVLSRSIPKQETILFPQQTVTSTVKRQTFMQPQSITTTTFKPASVLKPSVPVQTNLKTTGFLLFPQQQVAARKLSPVSRVATADLVTAKLYPPNKIVTPRTVTQQIVLPKQSVIPESRITPAYTPQRITQVTRVTTPRITPTTPSPSFPKIPSGGFGIAPPIGFTLPTFSLGGGGGWNPFKTIKTKQKKKKVPSIIGSEFNVGIKLSRSKVFSGISARRR